jgi:hypothetical protein
MKGRLQEEQEKQELQQQQEVRQEVRREDRRGGGSEKTSTRLNSRVLWSAAHGKPSKSPKKKKGPQLK